jgi:hypothetical protein
MLTQGDIGPPGPGIASTEPACRLLESMSSPALALAAHRLRRLLDRPALLLQRRADPGLAAAAADKGGPGGAGISKYIAPRALLWFRWAAVVTWITGALDPRARRFMHKAFMLQEGSVVIGIGAWLGTIMLFNVWVLIWPNQKKVLGIVAATDEEKAKARRTATARLAHQLPAVPADAAVHGRSVARPAVLTLPGAGVSRNGPQGN